MPDIEIEIDGKRLNAKPNSMVIQVADEAGIYIPRFCYHKHLSIAANCRMCLVEVEKSAKPLPACATPVAAGMKIFTRSGKALAAQKAVMEFLLINHPLDCPICDQGGECELQDLSMGYGGDHSFYTFGKRSIKDKDIGPLVATDMTRCIQCTRCVRFGTEVAGLRELGAIHRGENMEITTFIQHAMHSEVSGNVIDICPVGALTSKPFRFTARAWELKQFPSIAAHDCMGANINIHTRNGKVMRAVPRENPSINETWIADRERYSYQGLYHPDRLGVPKARTANGWKEIDWQTAFELITDGLKNIINLHGAEAMGALTSPSATVEEFFLLQKIMRQLGSPHIDHRLRQVDFRDQEMAPLFPGLQVPISDLENFDRIILIGSNIQKEQPSAALRVRKAFLKGSEITAINMLDYSFNFGVAHKKTVAPHQFVKALAALAHALGADSMEEGKILLTEQDYLIADSLRTGQRPCILLGALAQNHPQAAAVRFYAHCIAERSNAIVGTLTEGSNAAGAWLAGAVPHREAGGVPLSTSGLNAQTMLSVPLRAYLLLNIEPDHDCANPVAAANALESAEFIVAFSLFKNPILEQTAHVILPMAPFTETSGTFVNAGGTWQSFTGAATPYEESRPAWKILRVLGNFLSLKGFDYNSSEEILAELKSLIKAPGPAAPLIARPYEEDKPIPAKKTIISRIGEIPLYAIDSLVRRSAALQQAQVIMEGELAALRLHPDTAEKLLIKEGELVQIKQNSQQIHLPALFDRKVPLDAVFIAGATSAACQLSELFGLVEVFPLKSAVH